VQCASNMHQISVAVMLYAANNRDAVPPLYADGEAKAATDLWGNAIYVFDGVHWGAGGSLWFLLERYGISPNSNVAMCPEVRSQLNDYTTDLMPVLNGVTYPNARFTYMYNKIIGGIQAPTGGYSGIEPRGGHTPEYAPSVAQVKAKPYKLGQVKNASQVGLFLESMKIMDVPEYYPTYHNVETGFNLHYQPDLTSAATGAHQYLEGDGAGLTPIHSRRPGIGGPMTDGLSRVEGTVNVAYCDGSVRNRIIHEAPPGAPGGMLDGDAWVEGTACDPTYNP
jgi:prepilin-type processing-associated H-X9-DG protein